MSEKQINVFKLYNSLLNMRLKWPIVKFGTAKFMSAPIVVSATLMMQKPVFSIHKLQRPPIVWFPLPTGTH